MKIALFASAAFVLSSTSAIAQENPANQKPADDGDIVVTARRSSESLMQIPVQVNVATGADLARVNATNLEKISENIPFVSITKLSAGNGGAFNIRGIGNYSVDTGVQQSVLLSIDDVFIGRPRIANGAMFDIKQVEVLKGPQSLFYGKNTVAGVVSIASQDPGNTLSVQGGAGYEFNARERYAEVAVSGPIVEGLTARLALRASALDGWIKNVGRPRINPVLPQFPVPGPRDDRGPYSKDVAGRLTLLWNPSSNFEAKFKYFHDTNDNDGETGSTEVFCQPGIAYSEFGVVDDQTDCKANAVRAINNHNAAHTAGMPGGNGGKTAGRAKSDLASLKLSYDAGSVSLTSVTGYYKLNTDSASNLSFGSLSNIWAAVQERSDGISQEIRLATDLSGPVNFMGGVYLADNKTFYNANTILLPLPVPLGGSFETFRRFSDLLNRTYSAFGQVRWDIQENLTLEAGLRYSNEKISATDGNTFITPAPGIPQRPAGVYFVRSKTENHVSPEVTLTWHPDSNQTLYAAYKTGNKPGGYSFPALATVAFTLANTNFLAEKVEGFEAGYKATLLDRSVRFTLTGYRFKYTNQQVSSFDAPILSFITGNAAASIVQGVEADVTWTPSSNLNITGALGYNDAHYEKYDRAQCYAFQTAATGCVGGFQDLSGRTLPRAPQWAGQLGATYRHPIGGGLEVSTSGSGIYTGKYNPSDTLDPFLDTDGYWRFNASLALGAEDGSWELGVYGRNLSDQYKPVYTTDKSISPPGVYIGPFIRTREVVVAFKFNY